MPADDREAPGAGGSEADPGLERLENRLGYRPRSDGLTEAQREILRFSLQHPFPVLEEGVLEFRKPVKIPGETMELGFLSRASVDAHLARSLAGAEPPESMELQLAMYDITETSDLSASIDILWRCEPEAMPAVLDHFERAWKENYPEGEGWEVTRRIYRSDVTLGIQNHELPKGHPVIYLFNREKYGPNVWSYRIRADPATGRLILTGGIKTSRDG